ncbi:MAG: hypothetical protein RSO15_09860 [Bacteroides sp.]|uniref:hypothetical protein n=1 Tax=Bacteroides sp. TaxID=29523 RepID=UPI002FC89A27
MEKERISIVSESINFDQDQIQRLEDACSCAFHVYSTISDKFKKDQKYGDEFVAKNQELIGMLTQAAMQEVNAKVLAKSLKH